MYIRSINPILNTDGYKPSMFRQMPPGTEFVTSYIESRGGRHPETLFFGLQAFLLGYMTTPIARYHIQEAGRVLAEYGVPFNQAGWERILRKHAGFLPVEIQAVPEGSVVPTGNALVTITNTDPELPWVTTYLETALLRAIWYPTTVATNSFMMKRIIKDYLEMSSDFPDAELPYKLHDFGARGVSSLESAALGGMAHLVSFKGTDTISGIMAARSFYDAGAPGASIPASEHSTITSWGRDHEVDAYRNMITQFGEPGAIFACVSDSYDIFNAVENLWGGELRDEVIRSGATLVVRPDSGDPVNTPIMVVESLAERFGSTTNTKGFQVLNHVRVIQGDGIGPGELVEILAGLTERGFSATNIAFGMGGKLLQAGVERDSQKFAMKASAAMVNGEWRDVYKDPITDAGKRSKRGRLTLVYGNDNFETVPLVGNEDRSALRTVYHNGHLPRLEDFEDIRARANSYL